MNENTAPNKVDTQTAVTDPVIREATAEEASRKVRVLSEPEKVEEVDMENATPSEIEREGRNTSSAEVSVLQKDERTKDVMKGKVDDAAAKGAQSSSSRGTGSLIALSEVEEEAAKQTAAGTNHYFGASAAARLRKQLATTRAAASSSSRQTAKVGDTPSSQTIEEMEKAAKKRREDKASDFKQHASREVSPGTNTNDVTQQLDTRTKPTHRTGNQCFINASFCAVTNSKYVRRALENKHSGNR